jgi:transcriptional regulator with XRE-family HTH domain
MAEKATSTARTRLVLDVLESHFEGRRGWLTRAAELTGLTRSYVSKLMSDPHQDVGPSTVKRLQAAFGLPSEFFYDEYYDPKNNLESLRMGLNGNEFGPTPKIEKDSTFDELEMAKNTLAKIALRRPLTGPNIDDLVDTILNNEKVRLALQLKELSKRNNVHEATPLAAQLAALIMTHEPEEEPGDHDIHDDEDIDR